MNYKRAIWMSILLYVSSFLLYAVTLAVPYFEDQNSLKSYIFFWVFIIPLVLIFSKWFFKKLQPSTARGFQFGVIIVAVSLILDGLSALGAYMAKQPLDQFVALYTDWKLYATLVLIVAVASVAGGEFDGTGSKDT